jgi:predicted DCC family thiol-disulfide oxidoreductase YuxK
MEMLHVLYDERCGLCRWARRWAAEQPAFVPLIFIPAGSEQAARLFPELSKPGTPEDLIVVSDEGEVYRNHSAWIMCLYALEDYREWSLRLASPILRPFARQAFTLVSQHRSLISHWLGMEDEEVANSLRRVAVPACATSAPTASNTIHAHAAPSFTMK